MENTARIFEDVGGYHICDEACNRIITSSFPKKTKSEALRSAYRNGYTHAIGSGTYWGNIVRKIPKKYHER